MAPHISQRPAGAPGPQPCTSPAPLPTGPSRSSSGSPGLVLGRPRGRQLPWGQGQRLSRRELPRCQPLPPQGPARRPLPPRVPGGHRSPGLFHQEVRCDLTYFFFFPRVYLPSSSSPLAATFPLQINPSVLFSTRLPPAPVTRTITARAALSLSPSGALGEDVCQGAAGSQDVFFGGVKALIWGLGEGCGRSGCINLAYPKVCGSEMAPGCRARWGTWGISADQL